MAARKAGSSVDELVERTAVMTVAKLVAKRVGEMVEKSVELKAAE
jgi:hypothetical protein